MLRTLLLSSSLAAALAVPAAAQTAQSEPTLSLSASAEVNLTPEYARVSAGVVSRADTAQAAMRDNARAMAETLIERGYKIV